MREERITKLVSWYVIRAEEGGRRKRSNRRSVGYLIFASNFQKCAL